jgi:hypothetical protein
MILTTIKLKLSISLNKFVKNLLESLDLDQLEREISANTNPTFFHDYSSILSDLFEKKHTLNQAQKSLLYWKDAISDMYLQKALVAFQYRYIEHLANQTYAPK